MSSTEAARLERAIATVAVPDGTRPKGRVGSVGSLLDGLRPNRRVGGGTTAIFAIATIAAIAAAWHGASAMPGPTEVAAALAELWQGGLFDHLLASLALELQALAWSTGIALALAYLTVVPAVRPFAAIVGKLRFTGMVGWGFVFAVYARDGHQLQVWMLVFGTAPFMLTSMVAAIAAIPRERFDHARTIHRGEWRVVYEVVVRGTADQALEIIRQSAAMGWMMLTMVEGVVRAGGGLGVLMLDANKHLRLDAVFALVLVVLVVGAAQDHVLAWVRRIACPYAVLTTERR